MGLADIVRGMRNGPRGERPHNSGGGSWISRLMVAALGILAYKTFTGRNNDADRNPEDREPPRRRWL